MKHVSAVVDYLVEAVELASPHGGAKGENPVSIRKFREGSAEGFTIQFGDGPDAPEYHVTIVRSR